MKPKHKFIYILCLLSAILIGYHIAGQVLTSPMDFPLNTKWISDEPYIAFGFNPDDGHMIGAAQIADQDISILVLTGPARTTFIDFYRYDEAAFTKEGLHTEKLDFLFGGNYKYNVKRREVIIHITDTNCAVPKGKIIFHASEDSKDHLTYLNP